MFAGNYNNNAQRLGFAAPPQGIMSMNRGGMGNYQGAPLQNGMGGTSAYLSLLKYPVRERLKFRKNEREGPIVILVGRRGTGKSFCLRDICWHFHKEINKILVMSGTEDCSPFFANFVPANCIRKKFMPDLAASVVNSQYIKCKELYQAQARRDPRYANEDCRIMWILDDCMYDEKWAKTELMRYIFTCGRHLKIFLIVTMQYPLGIPPPLRSNIDAVFLMNDRGANVQKIYDTYASGVFDNFNEFKMVFSQVTQDRHAMVIDQNSTSNRLQDLVFYYKAQDHGPFRMGSPEDWRASEEEANDAKRKYMNDVNEYQPGMNKRAKTSNNVQIDVFRA